MYYDRSNYLESEMLKLSLKISVSLQNCDSLLKNLKTSYNKIMKNIYILKKILFTVWSLEREANFEKYSNLSGKSLALRCLLETLWFPLSGGAGGWWVGGYTGQRDFYGGNYT